MSQSGYAYGNPGRSGPGSYGGPPSTYGGGPSTYGGGPSTSYGQPHSQSYAPPPSVSQFSMAGGRRSNSSDSGFMTGVKYALVALNFIFILIGGTGVGVGVWVILQRDYMSVIYGNVLMSAAGYIIVVSAGVLFVIAFLGCLGAYHYQRYRGLLITYLVVILAISVFLFIGAILAVVFRTQVQDSIQYEVMRNSLRKDYGVNLQSKYNQLVTQSWDTAQRQLRCCGVEDESWTLYQSTEWYKSQSGSEIDNSKMYVPESCCSTDQSGNYHQKSKCQNPPESMPPRVKSNEFNEALNYRGCFNAGKEHVERYTGVLIGMGIGAVVLLIAAILCSFVLLCNTKSKYMRP